MPSLIVPCLAEIALLSGVPAEPLTYLVPDEFRAVIGPGSLVVVPLRANMVTGVVLRVNNDAQAPAYVLRAIDKLLDNQPVLDTNRLTLAAWISREYHTPLGRACALMIPPGLTPKTAYVIQVPDPSSASEKRKSHAMTPAIAELVRFVKTRGPLLERKLAAHARKSKFPNWRDSLTQATNAGFLVRKSTLEIPKAHPTRTTVVQLTIGPQTVELAQANFVRKPSDATVRRSAIFENLQRKNGMAWADWLLAETGATRADLAWMQDRGYLLLGDAQRWRDPLADSDYISKTAPPLTGDQQRAWEAVARGLDSSNQSGMVASDTASNLDEPREFLLRGVTGSGKTEIYLRAAEHVLAMGNGAIILVPEISLTPQTARRFLERFPGQVALIHSRLSPGERYDTWRRIRSGDLAIVVGARSALFAPVPKLGLVVIDEEHDSSYKQDSAPHYDARAVATVVARQHGAIVILGSATPSLEIIARATLLPAQTSAASGALESRIKLLELPNRVRGHADRVAEQAIRLGVKPVFLSEERSVVYQPLPNVQIVDMRRELRAGNSSMFGGSLRTALAQTLSRGEQALLFLNRRGLASCVVCRDCGQPLLCPNDDVPLTLHGETTAVSTMPTAYAKPILQCHHCEHRELMPSICPGCGSPRIKQIGIGTQRIEDVVQTEFKTARIVRWDRDTASKRGAADNLLKRFVNRQADVLIGTQMIAKGLDLPMVTLVGVVLADVGLFLPDFRASERVFDLIEQVAGRAGRGLLKGQVIVQTYNPDHPAISFAAHHDVLGFAAHELKHRKMLDLPPFTRLVRFEFADPDPAMARQKCSDLARQLRTRIANPAGLIGPSACYFPRRNKAYRWQVVARCVTPNGLLDGLQLPRDCIVDVDPATLL